MPCAIATTAQKRMLPVKGTYHPISAGFQCSFLPGAYTSYNTEYAPELEGWGAHAAPVSMTMVTVPKSGLNCRCWAKCRAATACCLQAWSPWPRPKILPRKPIVGITPAIHVSSRNLVETARVRERQRRSYRFLSWKDSCLPPLEAMTLTAGGCARPLWAGAGLEVRSCPSFMLIVSCSADEGRLVCE